MSGNVTKTQPRVNDAQPKPLGLVEQVALVQLYLRRVYGVELMPMSFPEGVILINAEGEEIAEISADGEVYLCDSGEMMSIEDVEAFQAQAERLADAYRSHARKENSELLEMAQHIFGSDELKQIGRAMAERRGVKQPF